MFSKKKKLFEEMTSEEILTEIPKMSTSDLRHMKDIRELSFMENEAVNAELDRRSDRLEKTMDKGGKVLGVMGIISGVVLGALELICDTGKD